MSEFDWLFCFSALDPPLRELGNTVHMGVNPGGTGGTRPPHTLIILSLTLCFSHSKFSEKEVMSPPFSTILKMDWCPWLYSVHWGVSQADSRQYPEQYPERAHAQINIKIKWYLADSITRQYY